MESDMVDSFSNTNNMLIKDYFTNNFSNYNVKSEIAYGPYWGIEFVNKDVEISISGDIGFSIEIRIDGTLFQLWQYDRSVNKAMKTSNENILFQLDVLKIFLTDSLDCSGKY
jgi:hypothetical protein